MPNFGRAAGLAALGLEHVEDSDERQEGGPCQDFGRHGGEEWPFGAPKAIEAMCATYHTVYIRY